MPVQPSLLNVKPDHPLIASIPKTEGTSLFNAPPVGNPVPKSDVIPAPDYKDPKSRQAYAEAFVKKYGDVMHNRADTPLRINETMDEATGSAKDLSIKAAKPLGLDPALLYASSMEEGMSGLFKDKNGVSDFSGNMKYPTGGFRSFGLDNFADQAPNLVKKGYLSKDFANQYIMRPHTNEKGQVVHSADFKSPDAALQAKAAVVRDFQDQTEDYAKKNGITMSPKVKEFMTLVAYNAGAGNMQKMMKEYKDKGLLTDDKVDKDPTGKWKTVTSHIAPRLQMRDALKKEKLF